MFLSQSKALRLDQRGVKKALQHPMLKGKKSFGRGKFAAVFEGTRNNTIMKLMLDNVSYDMLNDSHVGVEHSMFPKVWKNFGEVGEVRFGDKIFPLYLSEIERLEKLRSLAAKRLARCLSDVSVSVSGKYWRLPVEEQAARSFGEMANNKNLPIRARNALRQLEMFSSNTPGGSIDMHMGNFMQRGNGELVINDPIANMNIYTAAMNHFYRR